MVNATPNTPEPVSSGSLWKDVRPADPDIIQISNESLPIEVIADLTFEQIGGQEIINVARNDLINGQNVIYRPIKNLQDIYIRYNSKNIIEMQGTFPQVFNNFSIDLLEHVPSVGSGPNESYVYLDSTTGNIVIDVINIVQNEQVEVELINNVTSFNDTIYTED